MGIPTDPGYELYVESENVCFPSGRTPKKIFASIFGVKRGTGGGAGLPPAPNFGWRLEYDGTDAWVGGNAQWEIVLRLWPYTYFTVTNPPSLIQGFAQDSFRPCQSTLTNSYAVESWSYYDGTVVFSTREII
jgi:hypothetical protein